VLETLSLCHSSVLLDGETDGAASILDEEVASGHTQDEVKTRAVQSRPLITLA
jgi:hypothetical protein